MALLEHQADRGEDERDRFERDGFLRVPRALTPTEVEDLVEAVDRVWWRHRRVPPLPGAEPLHLLAFLGEEPAFLELVDHPTVLPTVVGVLGSNIFVYHCHLDVHPPASGEARSAWMWHQDGGIQNRDLETQPRPRLSVKVAFFLTDLTEPGRGNLVVLPGSHRANALERPADGSNDVGGAVPILAGPGDAVLFDRRLWHMRSENRSELTRRALFLGYTYRWVRPRDDLRLPPEVLAELTPIRAQLLGAGSSAPGYWVPNGEEVPLGHLTVPAGTSR